jgi:gas vesicle structural protein
MPVKRSAPQASVAEVLDRVLDRGIVIDAWLRVSVAGITLIDVDARVVVASIDTYVQWSDAMAGTRQVSRPFTHPDPHGREPAPARRAAPRPRVRLSCSSGCSFVRSAPRVPAAVRCPVDRGRVCAVMVVPAAPHRA